MQLPELQEVAKTQRTVYTFGGYNATNDNSDWAQGRKAYPAEFSRMKNMSSKGYPALVNRPVRGDLTKTGYGSSITYDDPRLYYYESETGSAVWKNGSSVYGGTRPLFTATKIKGVAHIGSRTVGFYDEGKMIEYNWANSTVKELSWSFTNDGSYTMYVVPFMKSGNNIQVPQNVSDGDTALENATWNTDNEMTYIAQRWGTEDQKDMNVKADGTLTYNWITDIGTPQQEQHTEGVPTSYCGVKIVDSSWNTYDLSGAFLKGETITISGGTSGDPLSGAYTIMGFKSGWMIIVRVGRCIRETGAFKLERVIPEFSHVILSENRLWGGTANGREIYATQQGLPQAWQVFSGDAADSIALTIGSERGFTGACSINGTPIFFKENYMHIVSGDTAQTALVKTLSVPGVAEGCEQSLTVMNDIAYYVGRDGVYCTNGGRPTKISQNLGEIQPKSAVGGALNGKYYVCIEDPSNTFTIYVYDSGQGLWHVEDNTKVLSFLAIKGDLFFTTEDGVFSVNGGAFSPFTATKGPDVAWEVVSEPLDYSNIRAKYVNRIVIKMILAAGATATVSMQYDNKGEWEQETTVAGLGETRPQTVWIVPKRCHTYKYKINGEGNVQVISITNFYQEGSDIWL